ncbi:MAG: cupredoxin domain-containing protein [Acidobacteriota bacterium]
MRFSLIAATLAGVALVGAGVLARPQTAPRVIHLTAERFSFTPSEIRVEAGEEVELRIQSEDTAHGFRLIGTNVSAVVPKRGKGEVSVRVRQDQPGRMTFECTRVCGAGHNFMRGVLIVTEPAGGGSRP